MLIQTHRLVQGDCLRVNGANGLQLIAVRRGGLDLVGEEGASVLRAGEASLSITDVLCSSVAERGTDVVTVRGPAELARDVRIGFSDAPRRVPQGSVLLAPTLAFALRVVRPGDGGGSKLGDYYIERLLQEMMQGLLADTARADRSMRLPRDPYREAAAVLAAQFSDPELTSSGIAETVNLSRRQLEREFRKRGTTIRGELRRMRVESAASMLRDPGFAMLTIDQVAQHVGLSGASSLARAMAQEGRETPSRLRASSAAHRV